MQRNMRSGTYHRFYVGMGYSIELVEVQLEIRTYVDVGALVLCAITVLGCGEDWLILVPRI